MLTDINRIATLAKEDPARKFYSIAHLIFEERLRQAFWKLRKDASAGIDGVVHSQYAANVEENIRQLHRQLVEGKYKAQPLRRVYIPKENGKQRPISIPVLEDKLVQSVAVDLLNAIYEQDFFDCSYGFRPGRSQHQALDEVGRVICTRSTSWVLELDIQAYFDYAETDVVRDPSTRREFRYRTRHLWPPVLVSYRMPQIFLSEQYYA
jgi:retron-type reverse transcriptase